MAEPAHAWRLVAPWYDWPVAPAGQSDRAVARDTAPSIQKYESADFVRQFMADPAASLAFNAPEDVVRRAVAIPDDGAGGYAPKVVGGLRNRLSDWRLVDTDLRKLYLPMHKRFYLVVCELHCDVAGFPNASRDEVCTAGFVVRRVRREPAVAGEVTPARGDVARWKTVTIGDAARGTLPLDRVGAWVATTDEHPARVIDEVTLPMYPLVPDPRDAQHRARGRTMYFGVIPCGTSETDVDGAARFDDAHTYEVRCFVRRYDPACPRPRKPAECHGHLVWSAPTEPFRLAPHMDPVGTGNRPVMIQMPDLTALQAAPVRPAVRMVSPPNSMIPQRGEVPSAGEVCSFSIPLITLVARFAFDFFLALMFPIVMFLLRLKFCLPPGLNAQLQAIADAKLTAHAQAELTAAPAAAPLTAGLSLKASARVGGAS